MRRPTLLDVPPMPTLAATTTIRRARVEDAAALATLLGRAYASERWDAAGTEREMFGDETVKATLVVETAGRLVATASLQVRPDAPERGLVRLVATDEDRRREGLARALVIGVLALAQQAGATRQCCIRRAIGWRPSRCIGSSGSCQSLTPGRMALVRDNDMRLPSTRDTEHQ